MKIFILILLAALAISQLSIAILAGPSKSRMGDSERYLVTQRGTKPKRTTTYYAKPLHRPVKKSASAPKVQPMVYKVIIHDPPVQNVNLPKQEQQQVFKIIQLRKRGETSGGGKSVKILKVMHVKQLKDDHVGGW